MNEQTSKNYLQAFNSLNDAQRLAVTTIDGPILVIAGPGTGKTQLLTTRIGYILANSDSAPEDILCLTFSDAAARTMQNRLANIIGSAAFRVTIQTYHSFGSELILRYPDLFDLKEDVLPADELKINQIIRSICRQLDYSNPLKSDYYTKDIISLISNYKRALITPEILLDVCQSNQQFNDQAANLINKHLKAGERINQKQLIDYQDILTESNNLPSQNINQITSLKSLWLESLEQAIANALETKKMTALSLWKKQWLEVNTDNQYIINNPRTIQKQRALAEIYSLYNQQLKKEKVYDYDDMIIQAINGLSTNLDIKLSLQEKYQYILLDEFQDTNEAQFKIVELLADNPINEHRPNILAVGDDDQAIYRFQGAHYSHMERFYQNYLDVVLVNLKINYRSSPGIIQLSTKIREQISNRLELINKQAQAYNNQIKEEIKRVELPLDVDHLAWTAEYIKSLIDQGTAPDSIAVLAPEHSLLTAFIPYLHGLSIPISYERKDNVLDNDLINQLITMAKLVLSLSNQENSAEDLWPIILSYDQWQLPTSLIWQLSWQVSDLRDSWINTLLNHPETRTIGLFFIKLSQITEYSSFEQMLNYLIGNEPLLINEQGIKEFSSPFYGYYFSSLTEQKDNINANEWRLLGQLTTLKNKIKNSSDSSLNLEQFILLIKDYQEADIKITEQSPYKESFQAVNLMTGFAAKGSEFNTIILINFVDKTWGTSGRNKSSKIALPFNLAHVRLDNNASDEKLRLLFVALSRAKERLVMISYKQELGGNEIYRLQYFQEYEEDNQLISPLLPKNSQQVIRPKVNFSDINLIRPAWHNRHLQITNPDRSALLEDRLKLFRLSASNLNNYTDISQGGPRQFYLNSILKFPSVSSLSSQYGSVYHGILDWHFQQTKKNHHPPSVEQTIEEFKNRLKKKRIAKLDFELLLKRGSNSLKAYFAQTTIEENPYDFSEQALEANYRGARLIGEIDRLIVNNKAKTLHIIDFKTGSSYHKFKKEIKPMHHLRQLYFYKLLLQLSPQFKGYTVDGATIQFVEPDSYSGLITSLHLEFNEQEENRLKDLIIAVWNKIMALDFPDTESYPNNYNGILKFESTLLDKQSDSDIH